MTSYQKLLIAHCKSVWKIDPTICQWKLGPMVGAFSEFFIMEFPPHSGRDMWTYATNGMAAEKAPVELHIFSKKRDESIVELLTSVAYYSLFDSGLGLGHTVNFGRSWQGESFCTFGLISLPYLDGPNIEIVSKSFTKCYWLIPITKQERDFKAKFGLEALEEKFEMNQVDYLDNQRRSLIL
jgi:hypothetical protein